MKSKLKPAEIGSLLSRRIGTSELVRLGLIDLILRDVIQLSCVKTSIRGERAHLNAFHFSVGSEFEQYNPHVFELPLLKPFLEVRKGIPLPLYVTMFLQHYDGHLEKFRKSFEEQMTIKGLHKTGFLASIGIDILTPKGKNLKTTYGKLISSITSPNPPTPDNVKRYLLTYKELMILSSPPYPLLEQSRLKIVELLLGELKGIVDKDNSPLFQDIKFSLTYLANPNFSFSHLAENFDSQLRMALEEQA